MGLEPATPGRAALLTGVSYSLPMIKKVKNQTRVSSKHQVTIPAAPFRTAGFEPGDTLRVEAEGAGRVVLTRVSELIDRYSGCLDTGGDLRGRVDGLRDEWR
jgi:bifunctional DNA-binding transcriptional regulator/antitoxin component of YhaV-PrlF toxin-antitoxin module